MGFNVTLNKTSADATVTNGNSCYSLAGATYGVYTTSDATGTPIATFTTDANGHAELAKPLGNGTYTVKELKAPKGYQLDKKIYTFHINGCDTSLDVQDDPGTIVLRVKKKDAQAGQKSQGNASLAGAVYRVTYQKNGQTVTVEGTSDEQGNIVPDFYDIPFGTVKVQEIKAPEGYKLDTRTHTYQINSPDLVGDVYEMEPEDLTEEVIRGGVLMEKRDLESLLMTPLGMASLDGTLFEITNKSHNAVYVNGALYQPDEVCLTIEVKDGVAQSDVRALPYGSYELAESKPGIGYLWTDKTIRPFEVLIDGSVKEYREGDAAYNQVKRGDLRFVKVGEDNMHCFANVAFKLTSQTTGESHILATDENGEVRTETAWNPHSQNTNGNDDTENYDNLAGTWFGQTTEDWMVETQDGLCALPFDHYTLEELRCPGNEGYELVTVPDISITRDSTVIELGTIDDKFEGKPEIGTTATVGSEKVADPLGEVTLVDTVSYTGLTVGKTHKISGILMDKSTGKPLEIGGQQVTAEKEFTPKSEAGTVDLEYTFDASTLAGKAVVVFETLYQDGSEVASHADIEDEGQTVIFRNPKIGTTATVDGEKTADPLGKVTIIDKVTYIGLTPGKEYNIKGVLMDKSTGEKLLVDGKEVTAEATFTASKAEGSIDIPFTFDASGLAGKSVVVFESLYRDGLELAAHTDIGDEGQTIDFGKPDIQTTAIIDGNKVTDPIGEVTIVDTVEYTGLTIGKTYNVKGVLMDKSTGEKLLVDGKEITSTAEFTAEKENGTVEVSFTFDCSGLAGKSIVVFETLYQDTLEVAVHADIEDKAQTVTVNAKGGLLIKKTAEDNFVEGISFLVTGKDYAETFKTDAQGEIYIQDLPLGEYTVTEIENDITDRYVIEDGKTVTVEAGTEPATAEFYNKLKRGSLRIVKVETGTDTHLEGATFCLKDGDGQVVADGKTDKNGELLFGDLPWGAYSLHEVFAPEGHSLDTSRIEVEIYGKEVVEITVENDKLIPEEPTTSIPKTGDTRANPWLVGLAMAGMLAGAGGLVSYLIKKRRK